MTESINADRGEVGLTLDGHVYPMLPTLTAVNAIESQLGAVSRLVARVLGGSDLPKFSELAIIATECMKAAGRDRSDPMLAGVNVDKVAQMIFDEGLDEELLQSFGHVLANMITGGAKKKAARAAAAAAKTSESTTAS